MKKIIIITILLFSPLGVFAKENFDLRESKNTLSIVGACSGKEVEIELYQKGKGEPAYTSGASCSEGKFEFSENLLQWQSLKNGEYELVVAGDQQNIKKIEIQRPEKEQINNAIPEIVKTQNEKTSTVEEVISPENKFLRAFVSLQQAILDMRNWLEQTKYPQFAKTSIRIALDVLDVAVGEVSSLVMSSEVIVSGIESPTQKTTDVTEVMQEDAEVKNELVQSAAIETKINDEISNDIEKSTVVTSEEILAN